MDLSRYSSGVDAAQSLARGLVPRCRKDEEPTVERTTMGQTGKPPHICGHPESMTLGRSDERHEALVRDTLDLAQ